ncbi:MAG TPA: hypothetical protein PLH07_03255 [Sulfurovum sp.]|nr:MAG: hypothetical protein B7Y63_00085 [Sulfurovum sp. 35-42-20]OYZ26856.1 MAG: hypothetical protein B7Y23_00545 [Sulfurovum sp. 16-42-52]OYZ49908.1 MAG: hypothetical protein B7Y13_02895 [Sulfurovum sp. 24-42-9]OZA45855.1 MAG: hypothetical protein B7X80_03820 [Sulfurovum sp. 17-42-90]OZA60212.1 MAG: hypothetical protein B7X69_04745 [Sulfurovum sp. 39-42-12]HQR73128.1 hypothetical protein [Sulfurovum sp.]
MKKTQLPKDRLLKEILQEISNEHDGSNSRLSNETIKSRTPKTALVKWVENSVIVLLVVLIVFVVFYPRNTTKPAQSKESNQSQTKVIKTNEIKTENIPVPKSVTQEVLPKETINEKPTKIILEEETKPNKKAKEVLMPEKTQTEREIAKEKLRQQLRN